MPPDSSSAPKTAMALSTVRRSGLICLLILARAGSQALADPADDAAPGPIRCSAIRPAAPRAPVIRFDGVPGPSSAVGIGSVRFDDGRPCQLGIPFAAAALVAST